MGQFKDKKAVSSLLKEAILQLCRVSVGMQGNFTIDGIICIGSSDKEDQEFIVKIHEKVICCQENPSQTGNSEPLKTLPETVTSASITGNQLVNIAHPDSLSHSRLTFPSNIKQHLDNYVVGENQMTMRADNEVEILDIPSVPSQKQLFADIDIFSDIECTGCDFDDMSFSDVVIKPDPGTKICRNSMTSQITTNSADDSSDEELQIETLKAGRVRKPNKTAYTDINGAPVQVLSAEEFKRILKSEKLKRSRDKSPDFVNAAKTMRTSQDNGAFYRRQMSQVHKVTGKTADKEAAILQPWNPSVAYTTTTPSSNIVKYKLPQHYGKQVQRNVPSNPVISTVSQIQNEVNVTFTKSNGSQMAYPANSQVGNCIVSDSKIDTVSALAIQNQLETISDQNRFSDMSLSSNSRIEMHENSSEMSVCTASTSESLTNQSYNVLPQVSNQTHSVDTNVICLDVVNKAMQSKVHECPVCANVFDTFRHLDLHMYKLHPGMFLCPVCGKSFKQRSTRNRHIVALHSSEKNFTCHLCNVSFTRTDTLKKHFDVHHPDVAFPKKSYSYAKGISILSMEQIPVSNQTLAPQQQAPTTNHMGETKPGLYADNFITPIQVTAAVECSESVLSGVIPSMANITNITPYQPESVSDSDGRCHLSDGVHQSNDKLEPDNRRQPVSTDADQNVCSDQIADSINGPNTSSSPVSTEDNSNSTTKASLHSVTHVKPIDVTKLFAGIQQTVQIVTQPNTTAANLLRRNSMENINNLNVKSEKITSHVLNKDSNDRIYYTDGNQLGTKCNMSALEEQTNQIQNAASEISSLLDSSKSSEVKEDSGSLLQSDSNAQSVLGTIIGSIDETTENKDQELLAKSETDDSRTGFMDTIEISDEDNSEQM